MKRCSNSADGDLPGILGAWAHGWALSRAVPSPVTVPGGWRLLVGLPGHRVRYVLSTRDDGLLAELGRRTAIPGAWIKIAADPAYLRDVLPSGWTMADTGYLMTARFATGAPRPPVPYTTRVKTVSNVVIASVVDAVGETVASGRLAPAGPAGPVGVVDQVETAPGHRRRGLASVIMRMLSHEAVRLGMHTGVLVATDDGRGLYRTLGWVVRSPLAAARVPEAPGATPPAAARRRRGR